VNETSEYRKAFEEIEGRFPTEKRLRIPLSEVDVIDLRLGDVIYFDGMIFTGREKVLHRLIDEGVVPIDIKNTCNVMMTSAPSVKEVTPGTYEVRAAMPTTNYRFIRWLPTLFNKHGIRALISKGGLQKDAYQLFERFKAINVMMVTPAITASYAKGIRALRHTFWAEEFRTTDALYVWEVQGLGPFIVEADTSGRSLFKDVVNPMINEGVKRAYEELPKLTQSRVGEFKAYELDGGLYR